MYELGLKLRLMICLSATLTFWGCATERAYVSFSYTVEAERGLPPGMKAIAIQPAKIGPTTDAKWSEISANLIQSLVNESRTRFGTDVLVSDRRDSQVTFDEADLAAAGMSTAKGGRGGKLRAVEGIILSNINVKVEKHVGRQRTLSGVDISGFFHRGYRGGRANIETSEVETVTRNLTVQTDFKLLNTSDNQVWDQHSRTFTVTDRTRASAIFGSSQTEASLTPQDRIINALVERGAREFISRLMPCRIEVQANVTSSSNADCVRGVKLLRAESYEGALSHFRAALADNPGDHRAAYGAGVACEASGRYDDALRYYKRALAEEGDREYADARDRLKMYGYRARP